MRGFSFKSGTSCGLYALLLWSLTIALDRSVAERTGPVTAAAAVYILGGLLFYALKLLRGQRFSGASRIPFGHILICGALFAMYSIFLFLALGWAKNRAQAVEIGLVNYLWPILIAVLSVAILRVKAGVALLPGIVLALLGIFLVSTQGGDFSIGSFWTNIRGNPAPYALALSAALMWALYSNLIRLWLSSAGSFAPLFMLATGVLSLGLLPFHPEQSSIDAKCVVEIFVLALANVAGYVFWDLAMAKGNVPIVVSTSYFCPLFSTLASCIYLGVVPEAKLWIGCLFIIAGSILSWRSTSSEESVAEAAGAEAA